MASETVWKARLATSDTDAREQTLEQSMEPSQLETLGCGWGTCEGMLVMHPPYKHESGQPPVCRGNSPAQSPGNRQNPLGGGSGSCRDSSCAPLSVGETLVESFWWRVKGFVGGAGVEESRS